MAAGLDDPGTIVSLKGFLSLFIFVLKTLEKHFGLMLCKTIFLYQIIRRLFEAFIGSYDLYRDIAKVVDHTQQRKFSSSCHKRPMNTIQPSMTGYCDMYILHNIM